MSQENRSLAAVLEDNAKIRPDAPALVFAGQSQTFRMLRQRARRLAAALAAAGCEPGDRVAVLARNGPAMVELFAACELARFVAVPVNFRLAAPEIDWVIRDTEPRVLLFEEDYAETVAAHRGDWRSLACCVRIAEGTRAPAAACPWAEDYERFRDAAAPAADLAVPGPETPACIVHTTGTTGRPKGAVLTQGGLHAAGLAMASDGKLGPTDRGLICQPLFHVGARFLLAALHLRGACAYLEQRFDPAHCWALLARERITALQLAPTMLRALLDAPAAEPGEAPQLHVVYYSTGPIGEALLRRAIEKLGAVLVQHYGSTEAGVVTTLGREQHLPAGSEREQGWLRSAGTAARGVALRLVDAEGRVVDKGEAGEVEVRTPSLLAEYWNDAEATAAAFRDGWLATGDLGRLDEDGFLYIVDRKHDLIVTGGENVYPREVERVLEAHPGVREAAVFGVPDETWGERVHAAVVLAQPDAAGSEALAAHCREHLAGYKCPRSFELPEELPRLANGKVDKNRLRAPHWQERSRRVS